MYFRSILLLFISSISILAGDTLITLQNNDVDYNGCYDATIYNGYYSDTLDSVNYGGDDSLIILKHDFGSR